MGLFELIENPTEKMTQSFKKHMLHLKEMRVKRENSTRKSL